MLSSSSVYVPYNDSWHGSDAPQPTSGGSATLQRGANENTEDNE